MNNKNTLLLLLVIGLMAMAFVAASVFAYYPLYITVSPVPPPIRFASGSNSNQSDLGNNDIVVQLGANSTSASVTIHPTYQTTYYKDVLRIRNFDTKAYNVYLRVYKAIETFQPGSGIWLGIYSSGANRTITLPIATVDLLSTGTTYIGSLPGGGTWWEVDLEVYILEGSSLPSSDVAELELIYTPSSERPP